VMERMPSFIIVELVVFILLLTYIGLELLIWVHIFITLMLYLLGLLKA